MAGPAEVVVEHGTDEGGGRKLVVGPPTTVVGAKMLLVVAPPGTEEVVAPGTVLLEATVVEGQGPTPPPGRGQSTTTTDVVVAWTVVLVGPNVLVGPVVVQPSLWRREVNAWAADPRLPTLASAAWSRLQALVWAPGVWAAPTDDGSDQPSTRARPTRNARHGTPRLRNPPVPAAEPALPRSSISSPPAWPSPPARSTPLKG
jgi:hypothetical protein